MILNKNRIQNSSKELINFQKTNRNQLFYEKNEVINQTISNFIHPKSIIL